MKRLFSFILAFVLTFCFSLSAFASSSTDKWLQSSKYEIQRNLWSRQNSIADAIKGIADWIDDQAPDFYAGGGAFRGGGAGRTPFYTSTAENSKYNYNGSSGSGASQNALYNSGATTSYTVFNNQNKTYYNPVTNNNQSYTDIYYSPTYNTYNITNNEYNTYITNNYTYISYYIVDPVEELSWYYEIYYLLPDGRNSYNLTAEDVWGQYFIYDAVNYSEVAEDDGSTLALLHFDGNIQDSSSHNCAVQYETGANYNFVESDFTGALYWDDSLEHILNITLPESLDGDFTIEGRVNILQPGSYKFQKLSDGVWSDFSLPYETEHIYNTPNGCWNAALSYLSDFLEPDSVEWFDNGFSTRNEWNYYSYPTSAAFKPGIAFRYIAAPIVSVDDLFCLFGSNYYEYTYANNLGFGTFNIQLRSMGLNRYSFTANGVNKNNVLSNFMPPTLTVDAFDVSDDYSFAVVRKDKKIHYFVNGLEVYSCDSLKNDLGNIVKLQGFSDTVVMFDELRVSNKALYTDTYTPSAQPFDSNLVLVVPETGDESTIAVKSNIPVANLRVGGVRPTYPTNGDVYVYLEDDVVQDVQQYQVDGWYSVTASIYEDGAWVPFNGHDLSAYTMKPDDVEGGGATEPTPSPGPGGEIGGDDDDGGVLDFLKDLFGGLIDAIAALIGGAVSLLAGVLGSIVDLLTTLVQFFSGFTAFLSAAFPFLPTELMSALTAGIIIMVVLAIIKFIGGFL